MYTQETAYLVWLHARDRAARRPQPHFPPLQSDLLRPDRQLLLARDSDASPVATEVVELFLHVAAEAASVVSIQPLPHDTHAVLTLVFVKRKVLDLRGDATAQARMGLVLQRSSGGLGRHGALPPGVQGQ